jgi:hypothetical protein
MEVGWDTRPSPQRTSRKARDQAPPVGDLDRRAGKISADPLHLAIKIFRQKRLGDGIEGETVPGPDEAMVFVGNVTQVTEAPRCFERLHLLGLGVDDGGCETL